MAAVAALDSECRPSYKCVPAVATVSVWRQHKGANLVARKATRWARLTYPEDLVALPVLCEMSSKFKVAVNVAAASISTEGGDAVVLFSGNQEEIDAALGYLRNLGITVEKTTEPDYWRPD